MGNTEQQCLGNHGIAAPGHTATKPVAHQPGVRQARPGALLGRGRGRTHGAAGYRCVGARLAGNADPDADPTASGHVPTGSRRCPDVGHASGHASGRVPTPTFYFLFLLLNLSSGIAGTHVGGPKMPSATRGVHRSAILGAGSCFVASS